MELTPPSDKILLHSCCAPCSGAIIEYMAGQGLKPVVFFSNSNIDTREEYDKRLEELRRYCGQFGLELVEDDYDHEDWLEYALDAEHGRQKELAALPERQERCERCFRYRLGRAAAVAEQRGLEAVTTSLASSRWKSLEQVDEAGTAACGNGAVQWWGMNWRKGGLQPRRSEIIKEQNFYNQTFCGCEFSKNTDK